MLLSLIQPDSGRIAFYDRNGAVESAGSSARRLMAYVPQGNTLLSGTIRGNLIMGAPDATDGELWHALEIADAAQFVRDLPEGLNTALSERAGTLSEGQAQRLAIARAILRKTPVLILDEATSALDMDAERRIVENLGANTSDITCLVITHRLSLLDLCDRCYQIVGNQIRPSMRAGSSARA